MDCLEYEVLERYTTGAADAADVEIVETHCEFCPDCAEAVNALRRLAHEMSIPFAPADRTSWVERLRERFTVLGPRPRFAFGFAGAVALAVLAVLVTTRPLQTRETDLRRQLADLHKEQKTLRQTNAALQTQVASSRTLSQKK